jgi:hypothetical protein
MIPGVPSVRLPPDPTLTSFFPQRSSPVELCSNKPSKILVTFSLKKLEHHYTEQTSWLLFLKYLENPEQERATIAKLEGKKYAPLLEKHRQWESWAGPKDKDGRFDHNKALTGDDLRDFVNLKLFPYLQASRRELPARIRSNTKLEKSSARSKTRFKAATTCARFSTTSTNSHLAHRRRSTNCRTSTKPKSGTWATPGAMAASTTRRAPSSARS